MKINKIFVLFIFSIFTVQKIVSMEEGIVKSQLGKEEELDKIEQKILVYNPKSLQELSILKLITLILKSNYSKEEFLNLNLPDDIVKNIKKFVKDYSDSLNRNLLFGVKTANNVDLLMYLDIDCKSPDIYRNSPLNWITQNGHIEAAGALLKYVDEDYPNDYGQTAFHNLIITKNTDLAKLMFF